MQRGSDKRGVRGGGGGGGGKVGVVVGTEGSIWNKELKYTFQTIALQLSLYFSNPSYIYPYGSNKSSIRSAPVKSV